MFLKKALVSQRVWSCEDRAGTGRGRAGPPQFPGYALCPGYKCQNRDLIPVFKPAMTQVYREPLLCPTGIAPTGQLDQVPSSLYMSINNMDKPVEDGSREFQTLHNTLKTTCCFAASLSWCRPGPGLLESLTTAVELPHSELTPAGHSSSCLVITSLPSHLNLLTFHFTI